VAAVTFGVMTTTGTDPLPGRAARHPEAEEFLARPGGAEGGDGRPVPYTSAAGDAGPAPAPPRRVEPAPNRSEPA
jgi:hypothetical protein